MSGDMAVAATEPAERTQNSDKISSKDIESQILAAMRARVTYLRDGADSFTFESVRRLLEEDMGLEEYALDSHKSFVKEHLVKCLEDAGNDATSENPQESARKDDTSLIEKVTKPCEDNEAKKDVREETQDDEEFISSSEKGILTAENASKTLAEDIEEEEKNKEALLSDIRRALQRRTSYIRANSENITMGSLRRLLEQDLKLEKNSLDPFKKFINNELDEVLQISDAQDHSTEPIGKNPKKKVKSTPSKNLSSEEKSESDAEGDVDDEEVAAKKTTAQKRKLSKSKMTEKPKRGNDKLVPARKKAKQADIDSENDSNDIDNSQSSSEKPSKRTKETATPAYGKRVEHLKAVIKSCGMSIPPAIYRKAKQTPEEKREATLIKELEQILAKEGLSPDPSEKEIKEVRKRKDRSKELEGIDTSNIVSSSRRRSTTSFVPPPKPKITEESESESEESENGAENEEEEEEGNEEAEEGSQSEEESYNEDDGGEESE